MSIKHQVSINSTKYFKFKVTFEVEFQSQEVVVKLLHTENGLFNTSYFM